MDNQSQQIHIKKEIMAKLIEAYLSDDFEENTRLIPYDMRPTGAEVPYRCCIYKERAIIKTRLIANLGFPLEDDDERVSLTTYAKQAEDRSEIKDVNLTVLRSACKKCTQNTIYVTDLCQGCVARPCESACKFGAIKIADGRATVDETKCKKCGMCLKTCPYHAIVKLTVPCEDACPVEAVKKDETGSAVIDFEKCITCGKCIKACPFGAVHEKSQIIDILKNIKQKKNVVALIAPAIAGQFRGNLYQLKSAIVKAGFKDVFEVAMGADITTKNEAKEFVERMKDGKPFMTTSCCSGYIQLVNKHLTSMRPYVSDTLTPLHYTAKAVKEKMPDCITVFVAPCVAKRTEGFNDKYVDYVMNFEEMAALFIAKKIEVSECDEAKYNIESSKQARNFGVTSGVATAVTKALKNEDMVKPLVINGINRDSVNLLKEIANSGVCPDGCNLIEVMNCKGGCVGGVATITDQKSAQNQIKEITKDSKDIEKI